VVVVSAGHASLVILTPCLSCNGAATGCADCYGQGHLGPQWVENRGGGDY